MCKGVEGNWINNQLFFQLWLGVDLLIYGSSNMTCYPILFPFTHGIKLLWNDKMMTFQHALTLNQKFKFPISQTINLINNPFSLLSLSQLYLFWWRLYAFSFHQQSDYIMLAIIVTTMKCSNRSNICIILYASLERVGKCYGLAIDGI